MSACQAYETLRCQVLRGQSRPDGMGAIAFHGMWGGLVVLLGATPLPCITSSAIRDSTPAPVAHDPQLVRLLANMLLLTQSKDEYAY
jgi:hypothetical protein